MAKNKPRQQQALEQPQYDWRNDALQEWEASAMTRACAVVLGVFAPLPYEHPTAIDHSKAVWWQAEFKRRAIAFAEQQSRQERRQRGVAPATAGKLEY